MIQNLCIFSFAEIIFKIQVRDPLHSDLKVGSMAIFMFTKLDIQVAEAQFTSEPFPAKCPKPLPEGLCVNYFSVVVIRYHGQRQLTEAKFLSYIDLWFQRDESILAERHDCKQ